MTNQEFINRNGPIRIISGEGTGPGQIKVFLGVRTVRAIKCALTRERCKGDRWARAEIYVGENDYGDIYMDLKL
jgi:hypothetical protein